MLSASTLWLFASHFYMGGGKMCIDDGVWDVTVGRGGNCDSETVGLEVRAADCPACVVFFPTGGTPPPLEC